MTTLYNLHTDGDNYRITKFVDGEPESSYLVSFTDCQCPRATAGHPSCRHRQMLPEMLDRHLCNSFLFWDFDRKFSCDMTGAPMRHTIVVPAIEPELPLDLPAIPPRQSWRRI